MNFLKWRLGARLGIGFGLVALLIVILSAFSLLRLQQIANVVHTQNVIRTEHLERLYAAREALAQTGIAARNAFIFSDETQAAAELDQVDRQKAIYLTELQALTPLFQGNAEFEKIRAGLLQMAEELERPRQYREAGKMREFGDFLVNECAPLRRRIVADIDVLLKSVRTRADTGSLEVEGAVAQSLAIILAVSAVALVLGAAIGFLLTRGILREIGGEPGEVSAIAGRIASGDLAVAVRTAPGDRSSVMYAMKRMRDSLWKIVADVRVATDTIAGVSSEIAAGNLELSSRTSQQAAVLEETASSAEQLTAAVRQNADNARQAKRLVVSASEVAEKGGEIVSRVVITMDAIHDAARKITDITGVIDSIAFQTNILALNAAVEAARAGEEGRGFAVVAAEVRALAQRATLASREIKSLIAASEESVDAGSVLVAQAGNTMTDIVASVRRVADIMTGIASASDEQRVGIEQVNQAVGQMDQVTQKNAALVEEAAASAQALQQQAGSLTNLVSVFQFAGVAAGRP